MGFVKRSVKSSIACTMNYGNSYIGYFQVGQSKLDLPLCPDKQGAYDLFLYIQAERGPYQSGKLRKHNLDLSLKTESKADLER